MPFDGTPQNRHPDIEHLLAARARIAWSGGWAKQRYVDGFAVCAWQAIEVTSGCRQTSHIARIVARELPWPYRLLFFGSRAQIILFNDRTATTQPMVIALFDRAIARRQEEITREQSLLCAI